MFQGSTGSLWALIVFAATGSQGFAQEFLPPPGEAESVEIAYCDLQFKLFGVDRELFLLHNPQCERDALPAVICGAFSEPVAQPGSFGRVIVCETSGLSDREEGDRSSGGAVSIAPDRAAAAEVSVNTGDAPGPMTAAPAQHYGAIYEGSGESGASNALLPGGEDTDMQGIASSEDAEALDAGGETSAAGDPGNVRAEGPSPGGSGESSHDDTPAQARTEPGDNSNATSDRSGGEPGHGDAAEIDEPATDAPT